MLCWMLAEEEEEGNGKELFKNYNSAERSVVGRGEKSRLCTILNALSSRMLEFITMKSKFCVHAQANAGFESRADLEEVNLSI